MTKEEYEKLLQSDYWKGYSYSLIKERNFTCQDCGRSFPNERNKLQVHHLVYRDVNPWSYRPEELLVLCDECHRKRHGYYVPETPPIQESDVKNVPPPLEVPDFSYYPKPPSGNDKRFTFLMAALVSMLLLFLVLSFRPKSQPEKEKEKEKVELEIQPVASQTVNEDISTSTNINKASSTPKNNTRKTAKTVADPVIVGNVDLPSIEEPISGEKKTDIKSDASVLEIMERTNHENVVKEARRVGVSTEGSTLEIMERINHANTVKEAKRVGVSTEGSTLDIMERINHANIVKEAKRVGVSTEGSTLEIMERINHANIVKEAQRVGVSTEGSTLEIMERINKKNWEKRMN